MSSIVITSSSGRLRTAASNIFSVSPLTIKDGFVGAKVTRTSAITCSGSFISWQDAVFDHGGLFDPSAPTVLTIPVTGWYMIIGYLNTDTPLTHNGVLRLETVGEDIIALKRVVLDSATQDFKSGMVGGREVFLEKGEQVRLFWGANGQPVDLIPSESGCSLAAVMV